MKTSTGKILLWIGILWVLAVLICGTVFLAGNPHYFNPQDAFDKLTLYGIIIGFPILSIPGFLLVLIGKFGFVTPLKFAIAVLGIIIFTSFVYLQIRYKFNETLQSVPNTPLIAGWETYTNDEIKFSMLYPSNWVLESVPVQTEENYKEETLKGREGSVGILWGSGFGGACPQGYENIKIKIETLKVCHTVNIDGSESWGGFSKDLGYTGFTANAKAYPPNEVNREIILKIISSMEFKQ